MEEIAIVILNYNGVKFLEKFLPNVIQFSPKNKIYVADNQSTDDSVQFLKTNYPQIKLIINSTNGGFAKGYNDALKQINSKYYLLLNSDIEVTENWLDPLYNTIQSEKIAACQPKILSYYEKQKFEHAGACGGFLWWNASPAKIFMGDVGSLALGGALAGIAITLRTQLLLVLLGFIFVLITASVIIQVVFFKISGGKRVFKMAPLQHHFELMGWGEVTIVIRFWIIASLGVAAGLGLFYAQWVVS